MPERDTLQALLTTHRPAGERESAHRNAMLNLLSGSGDPFSRYHTAPGHFTASAFVLSPNADALLLIHHRKLDRWLQPGGHVDPGDADLLAAARREVHEEVGLTALAVASEGPFDLDIHGIPAFGSEPAHQHFDVRFLFRACSLALSTSDEIRSARWFPLSELFAQETADSVMRAVRKLGRV
jgi:8-oxo-dGTP pyrophosphatase MutT (NUDIX family)